MMMESCRLVFRIIVVQMTNSMKRALSDCVMGDGEEIMQSCNDFGQDVWPAIPANLARALSTAPAICGGISCASNSGRLTEVTGAAGRHNLFEQECKRR